MTVTVVNSENLNPQVKELKTLVVTKNVWVISALVT